MWNKFCLIDHAQCLCLVVQAVAVFKLPILSWRNMSCSVHNQVAYLTSETAHQPQVWSEMTSVLSDQFAVSSPHHNTSTHNSVGFDSLLRREPGLHLQEHWIISSLWRCRVRKDPFRSGLRTLKVASNEAATFYFSMLGSWCFSRLKQWSSRN